MVNQNSIQRLVKVSSDGDVLSAFNNNLTEAELSPESINFDITFLNDTLISLHFGGFIRTIALVNANGERISPNFTSDFISNQSFGAAAISKNGQLLVGKRFIISGCPQLVFNNVVTAHHLITGEQILNFNPKNEIYGGVYDLEVLASGDIIISGDFTAIGRQKRNGIAKLSNTGLLDLSFNPEIINNYQNPFLITRVFDNDIYIYGLFSEVNGVAVNNFTKLNEAGELHPDFLDYSGFTTNNVFVGRMELDALGRIYLGNHSLFIIGGDTISNPSSRLVRLLASGELDTTFTLFGAHANDVTIASNLIFKSFEPNNIFLFGRFNSNQFSSQAILIKLEENGDVDFSNYLPRVSTELNVLITTSVFHFNEIEKINDKIVLMPLRITQPISLSNRPIVLNESLNFLLEETENLNYYFSNSSINTNLRKILPLADGSFICQTNETTIRKFTSNFFVDYSFNEFFTGAIPGLNFRRSMTAMNNNLNNQVLLGYRLTSDNSTIIRLSNNEFSTVAVGDIKEAEEPLFKVYPNPASTFVTIENQFTAPILSEIFSAQGKLVKTHLLHPGHNILSTSNFSKGLYIIRTPKGSVKFMVQ